MVGEINFNLLNPNTPQQVAQSFDPAGAYFRGQAQGMQRRGAQQTLQLNQMKLQGAQQAQLKQQAVQNALLQSGGDMKRAIPAIARIDPTAAFELQKQATGQQTAEMDQMIKANTLRREAADIVSTSDDSIILQTAIGEANRLAGVLGTDPTQGIAHLQQLYDTQGPEGLRREAQLQALDAKSRLAQTGETYSPSPLKKLIDERQALADTGVGLDDPRIQAYDSKISGTEIDITTITPDEVDVWGNYMNLTGKMPTLGRGKASTKIRLEIAKSAARQALGADVDGIPNLPDKTPAEAAFSMLTKQSDTKSIQGSLNFLEKQTAAMGSFVTNLGLQIDKVGELSKDLKTFDVRILNMPLRLARGKIAGSALQAKYDMYLAEIESEIGKLSTGSSASIAELSASAQEKWANIHDKNLSVKDMLSLLEETKHAANMRLQSVEGQLGATRTKMVRRNPAIGTRQAVQQAVQQPQAQGAPAQAGEVVQPQPIQNLIQVTNPQTMEIETWDIDSAGGGRRVE